jgi:hypothetical protein
MGAVHNPVAGLELHTAPPWYIGEKEKCQPCKRPALEPFFSGQDNYIIESRRAPDR